MWEYYISFSRDKIDLSKKIYKKIKKITNELKGVATLLVSNFDIKVLVAVPSEKTKEISTFMDDLIIDIYIKDYKFDYLTKNFNFEITNDIIMKAFIKALLVFDIETDKKIIQQKIRGIKSIVLDSFFEFRLKTLKYRWNDLINLANDNNMYLMSKDTFVELIKFLVSNLEYRYDAINIKQQGSDFVICDEKGNFLEDDLLESANCNDSLLITSLITLNPKRIRIDTTYNIKDDVVFLLYKLFSNRVEIFK